MQMLRKSSLQTQFIAKSDKNGNGRPFLTAFAVNVFLFRILNKTDNHLGSTVNIVDQALFHNVERSIHRFGFFRTLN